MEVHVSLKQDEHSLELVPSDGNFSLFPRIRISLDHFKDIFYSPNLIKIRYDINSLSDIWQKFNKLFASNPNIKLLLDYNANNLFEGAKSEEQKFAIFSKKAYEIRNNNIDKTELDNYLKVLSSTSFKRTLLPHQLLASYHLAFSQNECNFSVPGSGKTTTVLAAYEYLRKISDDSKKIDCILVIGPLSSFIAWKDEFKECFDFDPNALEIRGGVKDSFIINQLFRNSFNLDLILVSYGSVCSKLDILKKFLLDKRTMLVLDEAHRIKNVDGGVQASAVMSLAPFARSRVILTGTPAPNNYADLHNLFHFIWPSKNLLGYSIEALNNMSANANDSRIKDLVNRISPYFIRIKKSDLKLPDPIYKEPILVEMGPIQRAIYDAIAEMAIKKFEDNAISSVFKRSAAIRLRQASSNPYLLKKPLKNLYTYDEDSPEIEEHYIDEISIDNKFLDLVNNYENLEIPTRFVELLKLVKKLISLGEKIVIWCEFIDTCDRISSFLAQNGVRNFVLYGKTSPEEREAIIKNFKNPVNKDFNVIVANPHAVGESISLHQACHNAVYFEMGFNAGVYMQSKDRIHRVGLSPNSKTNYYFLHSSDSIDEDIYSRVLLKESKMIKIIESEEIPLISNNLDYDNNPDNDDVKFIIKSYYDRRKRI